MTICAHAAGSPHLPHIEHLLRIDDWLRAELVERHQTPDVVVKTNNAAKVLDGDNVAVGHEARTGVGVAEEQWQGAFNQSLLSAQVKILLLCIY